MKILPVGEAFRHALTSTLKNLPFAFHVSWPWMAIMLPVQAITAFYIVSNFPNFDPKTADEAQRWQILSANFPAGLLSLLASSSIAVNWHRYILLDEVPQGWQRFRLDAVALRYFGNIILLSLMIGLAAIVPSVAVTTLSYLIHPIVLVLFVPIILAMIAYTIRYSVKMPAIALDLNDFKFRDALQATQGNNKQVLGLILLVSLVALGVSLFSALISYPFSLMGNNLGFLIALAIQFSMNWAMTILSVTMLTSLYGFFVEDRAF